MMNLISSVRLPLPSDTAQRNSGEHLVQHGSPKRSHPTGKYPPVFVRTKSARSQNRSDSNGSLFIEREAHLCDKAWGAAAPEVGQDVVF
jgi:hypothetical protein